MKIILIPTDFSKNAYDALYYATQLFSSESCQFIIMHSFEDQVSGLTSRIDISKTEAVVDELYAAAEARCEEVKHKLVLDNTSTNHTYKCVVTSLALSRAINKLIVNEAVDFVIMGSKGATGARNILVGSNTLAMLRKIKNAPLLVVPQEIEFKPIEKIALATGFKRSFTGNELQPFLYMASLHRADVKILHVQKSEKMNDTQRANFHQLCTLLQPVKPENNWLPYEDDLYDAITSFLSKDAIDLLAMINYKHTLIARIFREATVKDIAKYTLVPFLVLPPEE